MMGLRISILIIIVIATACGQPVSHESAVFLSGDVVLDSGSKPSDPVLVQRICKGSVEDQTWTDSKGHFSFKVQGSESDPSTADAAQASRDVDLSRPIGNSTYYQNPVTTALRDCQVQAILAGYWSDRLRVDVKNTLDDTRVGTIVLHAVSRTQSLLISATTLAAPGKARSAYEKGIAESREQKWSSASKDLGKAVELYPKFAAAWFELGVVRERSNDAGGARQAWMAAISSDPKYLRPYESLVSLAERQHNWPELEQYSRAWIGLAPEDFPGAYLYNAFANAQLNKLPEAEAAARKGLLLDKDHKFPRLSYVLALLLMQKHDYKAAAESLRSYLALAPNASDAPLVRQELARLETNTK